MRATLIVLPLLAACVTNGEYQKVVQERDQLDAKNNELDKRVTALEAERARLKRKVDSAHKSAARADKAARSKKVAHARETLGLADAQKLSANLITSAGDIPCELWPDIAPVTVTNFAGLAEGTKEWKDPNSGEPRTDPLYNGTIFHRVIPNFMIQGGDPMGTGRGGPGYRFEDEVDPDVRFDQKYLLAMANAGPGTNGSQFFITDSTPRHLDGKHTIFGKCGNTDVLKAIITAPTSRGDRPVEPVTIERIDIVRG